MKVERDLGKGMTVQCEHDSVRRGLALVIKKGDKVFATVFVGQDEDMILCESRSKSQIEKDKPASEHLLLHA
jgi:hypothetical protein